MKNIFFKMAAVLTFACIGSASFADKLTFSGVLGNSGEQGKYLVRFGAKQARGLGVVYDKYGSLWDRGGDGVLNRYSVDGRLLASYPIPAGERNGDRITLVGDKIVLLLQGKIYTMPVDSPAGTKPTPLGVDADEMSFGSYDGKIAISQAREIPDGAGKKKVLHISYLNLTTKELVPAVKATIENARGIELLANGDLVLAVPDKMQLFAKGEKVAETWPRPSPGGRHQFLDGFWFGQNYHGTIRRFNAEFEAEPGVVLGGGSGSFIGHVDELAELNYGFGMAKINSGLFAVSGFYGIMHLIDWDGDRQQMNVARRIGSIQKCKGIALNRRGDVAYNAGMWKWDDRPETPQLNCAPALEIGQAVMLPKDNFVAASTRLSGNIMTCNFNWQTKYSDLKALPSDFLQGATAYQSLTKGIGTVLLLVNGKGQGLSFRIGSEGGFSKELGPVTLATAQPLKEWTSLAMKDNDTLLAAADGFVIEMLRDGENWKESKRWNSWGAGAQDKFGGKIHICSDSGRLWVSDTLRNRIVCLSSDKNKLIAEFGELDKKGDDLAHMDSPQVIVGRERRAVFFDSGNQRLVKLTLSE